MQSREFYSWDCHSFGFVKSHTRQEIKKKVKKWAVTSVNRNFCPKGDLMSMIRKYLMTTMTIAFLGVFLCGNGCEKSGAESSNDEGADETATLLCIKCGQIMGGELCCKLDQAKCPKCGLAKGSPGCCKIPEGAHMAALCIKCDKVVVDKACCGCGDAMCPVDEFIRMHQYPCPNMPK